MSLDPLNHDEINILDAVQKSRKGLSCLRPDRCNNAERREGGENIWLCNNNYCFATSSQTFRKIIKEFLADHYVGVDVHFLEALEPHVREKVKLFCEKRHDLLGKYELSKLHYFCTALDRRVPEEAQLLKKMEEQRKHDFRQHQEAWKKNIEEKRAAKKQEKQLRHKQRLVLKRERDRYYWVAYWAAKHAIREEKINSLRFKKRRKLISVYFFLKKVFL